MTRKKPSSYNDFDQAHFTKITKRRFKKKFKKEISATEINKIWKDFVQYGIIRNVLKGNCVRIDKHSTIQVVGVPVTEDKPFMNLMKNGRILRQNGTIRKADQLGKRKEFKYSFEYKNSLAKNKIIFKADKKFKKQLIDTLNNTFTYFQIKSNVNK